MNATSDPPIEISEDGQTLARRAQELWETRPIAHRLGLIRNLRHLIAERASELAEILARLSDRPASEKLVSEILPLADGCRWLEKNTARVLRTQSQGRRGRPLWLRNVSFEIQRKPFGLILVVSPKNYPLFLPAMHALQALAAGNAVLLKPAPGTTQIAERFVRLARGAGIDPALLTVLPEKVEAIHHALDHGVDKVIFTGSSVNGRHLLRVLGETNTPSVMELSGDDAMVVFADADLDLVLRALKFGQRLNHGDTCIAPRRLLLAQPIAATVRARLVQHSLGKIPIREFVTEVQALRLVHDTPFALGASIFTRDENFARAFAAQIKTGFVTINDLIVPTADPRMPFGGIKASGFGSTRGAEGLREMTYPHVIALRRGKHHRHFGAPRENDAQLFHSYLRLTHGRHRARAIPDFVRALLGKIRESVSIY